MNLLPLAALLIACLALAVAITSLVTVERLRRRIPIRRQHQVSGSGSVQVQSGGTITVWGDSITPGMTEEQIDEMVQRAGRHL
jgi:hypothetical protein